MTLATDYTTPTPEAFAAALPRVTGYGNPARCRTIARALIARGSYGAAWEYVRRGYGFRLGDEYRRILHARGISVYPWPNT